MRRTMIVACCVLTLAASMACGADKASLSKGKRKDIRTLMEMTGALSIGLQFGEMISGQIAEVLRDAGKPIPDSIVAIINEETRALVEEAAEQDGGLMDMMYAIYDKFFSHDDIKGLIAFYKTDLGKKTIQVMPALTQEGMLAGQQWGASVGPALVERLKTRMEEKRVELPDI